MADLPPRRLAPGPSEAGADDVEIRRHEFDIAERHRGRRLDAYMAGRFSEYSRTFIQALIQDGRITVNGARVKPSYNPSPGDHVVALVPMQRHEEVPAEDIPLEILYEDRWLVAVNKPPDLVVHPSKGHQTGTMVNALVHHFDRLSSTYGPLRPGVVHRLDRDTSGVILVIKDDSVHEGIARQFEERSIRKEYVALCEGRFELDGDLVDAPIGRDPCHRERMRVRPSIGRPAQTVYEVLERLGEFTLVVCRPKTGRTHQIRVHMQYVGHPIVADAFYGVRDCLYPSDLTGGEHVPDEEPLLARQALHARRITFTHPKGGERITVEAPLPADMARTVEALRARPCAQ
ncbi:MAG: RluA family pseudouridine synthase [Candidatus Brocadiaceae bacterium]|nr:RluA family pseudouridine synthase [Candidatus Brocadiaceae bacterium]